MHSILVLAVLAGACRSAESGDQTVHHAAEGAIGPYSGSVLSGEFCCAAGKIGGRGVSCQYVVETAIDAVEAEVARSGLGLADVVSSTVYLTDMGRYPQLNEIYARRFPAPYPARACIAVRELPAEARVEIQVIARRPDR
jgi:2-iminobutanoate/2-iminopropanoate deaminase